MTLNELERTLQAAQESGRIGEPVSLRVHLQVADASAELEPMSLWWFSLAARFFASRPSDLFARKSAEGHQMTALCEFGNGRTAFITTGRGGVPDDRVSLLLVGSRGIVQLEETRLVGPAGELLAPDSAEANASAAAWSELLAETLRVGRPVVV